MNTDLTLEFPGQAYLAERGEPQDIHGTVSWTSVNLLDHVDYPAIGLQLGFDKDYDEAVIKIGLSRYHMEDGTGRAFHMNLEVDIPWKDVARIRDYLNFLLASVQSPETAVPPADGQ